MVLGHIIVFSPADFRWTSWAWKCSQVHLWNGCHDRCRWVRIIILRFTSYTYWISYARTLGWKRKMWRHFFNGFYFKTQKSPFLEVKTIFFNNFFSVLAFKTIHTQMLFWSVFLKMHKKTVINRQKRPKWCFWQSITFYVCIFKNTDQKSICASIVFKAKSKPKHEKKNCFGVFSLKTKNTLFQGSKIVLFKSQISNLYFCVCSLM